MNPEFEPRRVSHESNRLNAVFSGGGIKGIALVGALKRFEDEGIRFQAVGGASAGAMVAAFHAAGYTAVEIEQILRRTDFSSLLDPSRLGWWKHFGWYKGRKIYSWIFEQLSKKGIRRFKDLAVRNRDLRIVASDLTNHKPLIFQTNASADMDIAEAVRMSIGLPLFFHAYQWGAALVIDGGIISNYPLWLFQDSAALTIGFKIFSRRDDTMAPAPPRSFPGFLASLVETMYLAHDTYYEGKCTTARTILIDDLGVPTTEFTLSDQKKDALFQSGYDAAEVFLATHAPELQVRNSEGSSIRFVIFGPQPAYADPKGKIPRGEVYALVLTTHEGFSAAETPVVVPVRKTFYERGMRVSWKWDTTRLWGRTWYRDPTAGKLVLAWEELPEFIGKIIQE